MLAKTATNEQLLIGYAACGAPELFSELYGRLQGRVYGYIRRLVRSVPVAEDLSQDTWIKVLAHADSYRNSSMVVTWVCAIAKNVVISRSRKPGFGREVQADADVLRLAERPVTVTPDHLAMQREGRELLLRAMLRLSEGDRQVLELVDLEELVYDEAAEILEVPVGTIRSRRHRAIARLKQHMAA